MTHKLIKEIDIPM